MSLKPVINASSLIEEVKKRPCIYDQKAAHGNQEMKMQAWRDIGVALFKNWSGYSSTEKEGIIRDMQTKWKSIRDNFSRQLRIQEQVKAGVLSEPSKKYVYMDQLSFLIGLIHKRERIQLTLDDSRDSSDTVYALDDTKPICAVSSAESVQEPTQSVQFVPIQPKPSFSTSTTIDFNPLNTDCSEPALKRVARSLDELVAIEKDDKADDPMGNKKFLLSLLPFLKKLPDDVNLEVRLQLMSVLQTYTSGKTF
ncbi:uncharacterized protein LOC115888453 [Sitophilus oryzae]|uniref:Uncharacterized protein LOC115888453 n=1 Tax=Sitophilus oryzae TaxID=7048 RepID=A0A6J2YL88_SITOR|nr:uncharacterized protein LOC115888453 [Sitophilus oryzae]